MTRVPTFDVEPVLATVVPSPDEYIAQLEYDNGVLSQELQRSEMEAARLRWETDQLRLALERANTACGAMARQDSVTAMAELAKDRDDLAQRAADAEQERNELRVRIYNLEVLCQQYQHEMAVLVAYECCQDNVEANSDQDQAPDPS